MENYIKFALIATVTLSLSSGLSAQTLPKDTLQREVVLEKEYVSNGEKAVKEEFTPLNTPPNSPLAPLRFVRETYSVGMKIGSHLFDPDTPNRAPSFDRQHFYTRIAGGLPLRFQLGLGGRIVTGTHSTLDLSLSHRTLKSTISYPTLMIDNQLAEYDTDLAARIRHSSDEYRTSIMAKGFSYLNSLYGFVPVVKPQSRLAVDAPIFGLNGLSLSFDRSALPLTFMSNWKYDLDARVSYAILTRPMVTEDLHGLNINQSKAIYDFNINALTNLVYSASDSWLLGTKLSLDTHLNNMKRVGQGIELPLLLATAPYLKYIGGSFSAKIGAQLSLGRFAGRSLLFTPDLDFQWHLTDQVSLIGAMAGGVSLYNLRETYMSSRYMTLSALSGAVDIVPLRTSLGLKLGNMNGFSATFVGGVAHYDRLMSWDHKSYDTDIKGSQLRLTMYDLRPLANVQDYFVRLGVLYLSPSGFQVKGHLDYHNYQKSKEGLYPEGLPEWEFYLSADYSLTPKLTLHGDISQLGHVRHRLPQDGSYVLQNPLSLNSRLSYTLGQHAALSLSVLNLLNDRSSRWLDYKRPGIGLLGTLYLNF